MNDCREPPMCKSHQHDTEQTKLKRKMNLLVTVNLKIGCEYWAEWNLGADLGEAGCMDLTQNPHFIRILARFSMPFN